MDNAYSMLFITAQQHLQLEGKGNKSADTSVTQATVKPERQPKPVVVTPVQRRKYKTKCICLVDDDGEAEPSQPAEESELEVIIKSLSLESLCSLQNNLTWWTGESILSWLIQVWDTAGDATILDGTWDFCHVMWVSTRGSQGGPNSQPLDATLSNCEGEIPLPRTPPAASRPVENHQARNPKLERTGCDSDHLLK